MMTNPKVAVLQLTHEIYTLCGNNRGSSSPTSGKMVH